MHTTDSSHIVRTSRVRLRAHNSHTSLDVRPVCAEPHTNDTRTSADAGSTHAVHTPCAPRADDRTHKKPLITMDEGLAFSSGADMPEPHQDRPVFRSDDTPTAKGADCVAILSPGANPLPVSSIARGVTRVDDRTTRRHKKPPRTCSKGQGDGTALAGVMNEQDRITHDTHFKGYL